MSDFLAFRKMVTPTVIQVIFWILVAFTTIASIISILNGLTNSRVGIQGVLGGLILLILAPLFIRIYCELLIVIFRIYQTLDEIKTIFQKAQH